MSSKEERMGDRTNIIVLKEMIAKAEELGFKDISIDVDMFGLKLPIVGLGLGECDSHECDLPKPHGRLILAAGGPLGVPR